MQYDDNPEFNEYLDRIYSEIIIEDFTGLASLVLFEIDEQEYINAYNQYVNQQKESTLEKVTEAFPAPIAFYYDRVVHGYDNNSQRLNFLRSTWETIIFFLYALIIGEVIDSSLNINSIRIFRDQRIQCDKNGLLSDRLGLKLEIIEKVLDFNSRNSCGLMTGELIPFSVVADLNNLREARNSISHSAALSEGQSKDLFDQLYPGVQDIIFKLRKLEFLSLLKYKASGDLITRIKFSKFKGCSLRDRNYEKDVDTAFINKNIMNLRSEYLFCEFENYRQIICLSPFACTIQHNGQSHIAWYKKLNTSTNQYSFEIVSDSPVEFTLASDVFDKPIRALGALL